MLLPGWIATRHSIQRQIRERVRQNLDALDRAIAQQHAIARLACEGGWYATLRTPAIASGEELAVRLLERCGVAVHPGGFFGFGENNRLVLSLLPEPKVFAAGIAALIAEALHS